MTDNHTAEINRKKDKRSYKPAQTILLSLTCLVPSFILQSFIHSVLLTASILWYTEYLPPSQYW